MSPIDAAIPLSVVPPKIDSPTKSLAEVYALREAGARLQGTQLENTARQQENDARTRAAADDAAIKSELQNAYDPANGGIDYQKAITRLHQGGHGTAAIKLADDFSKRQQQHAATAEAELKRHSADLEIGTQVLAGVHNDKDPENDDARWQAAKQHFSGMKDMAPDAAAMIAKMPDDYASAKPMIDSMINEGTKMGDRIRESHESLRDHMDAIRYGILRPDPAKGEQEPPNLAKERAEAERLQTSSAARSLAGARNDAEYQQLLKGFQSQQYSPAILNQFAPVWSKDAVEKAKSLTMTEKEYEELGIQRGHLAVDQRREKREEDNPGKTDAYHANDMQEYNAARSEYDRNQPKPNNLGMTLDPVTHKIVTAPPRKPYMSFAEWRKANKNRDENGQAITGPPAPPVATPPAAMAVPPPIANRAAAAPVVAPPPAAPVAPPAGITPPPQSPSLGANLRPPVGAAVVPPQVAGGPQAPAAGAPAGGAPQAGGVRVKLPPDAQHPQGRVIRFKDKATADAFAKAAGFTFTK